MRATRADSSPPPSHHFPLGFATSKFNARWQSAGLAIREASVNISSKRGEKLGPIETRNRSWGLAAYSLHRVESS